MSRSRRHTPICGITYARSNKEFKVIEHGRERAEVRAALAGDVVDTLHPKQFGNEWASPRDGKRWMPGWSKIWRK
jgi:gamma-glutamylcysteine synthetase